MKTLANATVRRSVALPQALIAELAQTAPESKSNLNRVVIAALRDLVKARRRAAFEQAMSQMAEDPAAQAELAAIQREFRSADGDGLSSTNGPQLDTRRKKNAPRRSIVR